MAVNLKEIITFTCHLIVKAYQKIKVVSDLTRSILDKSDFICFPLSTSFHYQAQEKFICIWLAGRQ